MILPQQFFDGPRGDSDFSPEKALMLAVLEDAIRCFQEYFRTTRARPRMLSRQAERWIRARDWNWPFSFNNVCDLLGMSPEYLRQGLIDWRDRERSRRRGRLFDAVRSHGIRDRVRIESLGSVTDFLEGEVALLPIEP